MFHSGPQMWSEHIQKSDTACTPSGADPRPLPLHSPASRVCCLPPRPPPHRVTPAETLCCVFGPHGTPRPCTPWSRDQPLPHQRLQQGQAHPEASGLWAGPPGQTYSRRPFGSFPPLEAQPLNAPMGFRHLRGLSAQGLGWGAGDFRHWLPFRLQ